MEVVLSIAGSDPSAGAGIQQDLKTITALGGYGATVITALTTQNTLGVQSVMPVPPIVVQSQLHAIFSDLDVKAIKIGQIPNVGVAQAIVSELKDLCNIPPIVLDPVMISTSGHRLMNEDCIAYVCQYLFPLCQIITPNIPETQTLLSTNATIVSNDAGQELATLYGTAFLLKGGHADSTTMTDTLYLPNKQIYTFSSERIESHNLHGTGCTLSSAIATFIAQGSTLTEAVGKAKQVISVAIRQGKELNIGHGNGPVWVTMTGK